MPQVEKPAEGIARLADYPKAKAFRIVCECTSDDHTVDAWIELEADDEIAMIEMEFHLKAWTPFFASFRSRVKAAWNILVKGVDVREHSILLKEQGARNLVAALDNAVKELEAERDKT